MTRLHTHYDNLKVTRDAPPEVIRAAYRSLCHRFHPDRHGGSARATHTFQLINSAYDVLSDPQRRLQHDLWIAREEAGVTPSDTTRAPAWDGLERRRRTGWLRAVGQRLQRSGRAVMLWTSALALSAMLLMLSQA